MNMIPKIIHQTAPSNMNDWHPIWEECQESWKRNFPDFEYVMWNDEDIEELVRNYYPEYFEDYNSFPYKIVKIDFVRFCILHQYGGIYADMDMYCYKNFYDNLRHDIYIVESWNEWNEKVQNSLMMSSKNHKFWIKCMKESNRKIKSIPIDTNTLFGSDRNEYILNACGPQLISNILDPSIGILPKDIFNPQVENQFNHANYDYFSEEYRLAIEDFNRLNGQNNGIITRHYLTGNWCKFQ